MNVLLVALLAASAAVSTENVSYPSGSETVNGFLARSTSQGKHGGLVVIHEWWGLNDFVKSKAKHFAEQGYVSLAVDLYRGKVAEDPDTAHQLMRGMPPDRAQRDLLAAFQYLASRPDVDPSKIAVVGWCMGGGEALDLVAHQPKLAGGVIYYGHLMTDAKTIAQLKTPLLGNFGEEDQGIPTDSVEAFAKTLKDAGDQVDFKVYPHAGHGFASSKDPKTFKAAAAKDADARADKFLAKVIGSGK